MSTEPSVPRRSPACLARACAVLAAALLAGCATVAPPTAPGAAPVAPALGFFSRIKVPDGHQAVLRLAASGVQVFRCEQRADEWRWVYRVPEADLRDDKGGAVARHGAGFTFEHADGSRLIGTVVAFDEAPRPEDLRWLLLATRSFGTGAFGGVTYVQRVNTVGGMPPARCEPSLRNRLLRVDFSGDFIFYRPG